MNLKNIRYLGKLVKITFQKITIFKTFESDQIGPKHENQSNQSRADAQLARADNQLVGIGGRSKISNGLKFDRSNF